MSDHTVAHPGRISELQMTIDAAQRDAKVKALERQNDQLRQSLETIFSCIKLGEQVDLTYPDGEVLTITKARKKLEAEGS